MQLFNWGGGGLRECIIGQSGLRPKKKVKIADIDKRGVLILERHILHQI